MSNLNKHYGDTLNKRDQEIMDSVLEMPQRSNSREVKSFIQPCFSRKSNKENMTPYAQLSGEVSCSSSSKNISSQVYQKVCGSLTKSSFGRSLSTKSSNNNQRGRSANMTYFPKKNMDWKDTLRSDFYSQFNKTTKGVKSGSEKFTVEIFQLEPRKLQALLKSLYNLLTEEYTHIYITFDDYIDKLIRLKVVSDSDSITSKQRETGVVIHPGTRQITLFTRNKKKRSGNIYDKKYITSNVEIIGEVEKCIAASLRSHINGLLGKVRAKSCSNLNKRASLGTYENIIVEKDRKERVKSQI